VFDGLNIVTKTDLEIKKFNFAKKLKLQTCLNFFVLSVSFFHFKQRLFLSICEKKLFSTLTSKKI